jgi:malate synthase
MEHHLKRRASGTTCSSRAGRARHLPRGTIKATVLIETLPAAFQMDEILYELREHSRASTAAAGTTSSATSRRARPTPSRVLPDRGQVGMDPALPAAYSQLLIQTCHRRGVHAMGGMAAQIPIKDDPAANEAALEKVRADKLREVSDGHDGTWVAHPGLVAGGAEIFDAHMPDAQPDRPAARGRERHPRRPARVPPPGPHRGGCATTSAWACSTSRRGCAATAACRSTTSWRTPPPPRSPAPRCGSGCATAPRSTTGRWSPPSGCTRVLDEEMARIAAEQGARALRGGRFAEARKLFEALSTAPTLRGFPHPARLRDARTDSHATALGDQRPSPSPRQPKERRHHVQFSPTEIRHRRVHPGRFEGITRPYTEADVKKLRGQPAHRAHARQLRLAQAVEAPARGALRATRSARSRATRPCSRCARGSRRSTSPGWQVAADANTAGADVPRPVALPRRQRAEAW